MRLRLFAAATAMLAFSLAAHADTFSFKYTFENGGVLTASLNGTLAADNNTFHVSGANSVTYNGAAITINPNAFQSYTSYYNNGAFDNVRIDDSGVLTLDGSTENFVDLNTNPFNGFAFGENAGGQYNGLATGVGLIYETDEQFVRSRFTASVTTTSIAATPEPSSLALLGTGLIGICGAARRRFAA